MFVAPAEPPEEADLAARHAMRLLSWLRFLMCAAPVPHWGSEPCILAKNVNTDPSQHPEPPRPRLTAGPSFARSLRPQRFAKMSAGMGTWHTGLCSASSGTAALSEGRLRFWQNATGCEQEANSHEDSGCCADMQGSCALRACLEHISRLAHASSLRRQSLAANSPVSSHLLPASPSLQHSRCSQTPLLA